MSDAPSMLGELLARPLPSAEAARALFAEISALAVRRGVTLRPPPPEPTSCCGRGCNGCVWEGFFDAASYWRDEAGLLLSDDGVE